MMPEDLRESKRRKLAIHEDVKSRDARTEVTVSAVTEADEWSAAGGAAVRRHCREDGAAHVTAAGGEELESGATRAGQFAVQGDFERWRACIDSQMRQEHSAFLQRTTAM